MQQLHYVLSQISSTAKLISKRLPTAFRVLRHIEPIFEAYYDPPTLLKDLSARFSSVFTALSGALLKPLKSPLPGLRKACLIVSIFRSPNAAPPRCGLVSCEVGGEVPAAGGDAIGECNGEGDLGA